MNFVFQDIMVMTIMSEPPSFLTDSHLRKFNDLTKSCKLFLEKTVEDPIFQDLSIAQLSEAILWYKSGSIDVPKTKKF